MAKGGFPIGYVSKRRDGDYQKTKEGWVFIGSGGGGASTSKGRSGGGGGVRANASVPKGAPSVKLASSKENKYQQKLKSLSNMKLATVQSAMGLKYAYVRSGDEQKIGRKYRAIQNEVSRRSGGKELTRDSMGNKIFANAGKLLGRAEARLLDNRAQKMMKDSKHKVKASRGQEKKYDYADRLSRIASGRVQELSKKESYSSLSVNKSMARNQSKVAKEFATKWHNNMLTFTDSNRKRKG